MNHDEKELAILFKKWCETLSIVEVMSEAFLFNDKAPFHKAIEIFRVSRIPYLIIVDHEENFQGVLSQKYVFKAQSPRKVLGDDMSTVRGVFVDSKNFYDKSVLDAHILKNIMNADAYVLSIKDNLASAIKVMAEKKVGCLPVLDDHNKVKGMVTDHNLNAYWLKWLKVL